MSNPQYPGGGDQPWWPAQGPAWPQPGHTPVPGPVPGQPPPGSGPGGGGPVPPGGAGGPGGPGGGDWNGELGPNTRCYAHADRLAGAVCRSCRRPICAECMVQAPVGWHCRQCVRRNARTSPVIRYRPGTNVGGSFVRNAPVTATLMAICIIAYVVQQAYPPLTDDALFWGAQIHYNDQWYRLITSIFLHDPSDPLHIVTNMLSLFFIGTPVEPALGRLRYLALFLVSGLGGSVACYLFTPLDQGSLGASGAIFGLLGAFFILARRARLNTSGILVIIGINLALSFSIPGISWQAHIGGLVTGLVLAGAFGLARQRRQVVPISAGALILCTIVLCLLVAVTLPGQFA